LEKSSKRDYIENPIKKSRKKSLQKGYKRYKTPQEMEKVSEAYYYDLVISSGEVKRLILKRIEELDVDLKLVLKEAGVTYHAFLTKYLRQKDPVSTPKLRQSHIISILEVLGIKMRIQFIVDNKDNVRTDHIKYKTNE